MDGPYGEGKQGGNDNLLSSKMTDKCPIDKSALPICKWKQRYFYFIYHDVDRAS